MLTEIIAVYLLVAAASALLQRGRLRREMVLCGAPHGSPEAWAMALAAALAGPARLFVRFRVEAEPEAPEIQNGATKVAETIPNQKENLSEAITTIK